MATFNRARSVYKMIDALTNVLSCVVLLLSVIAGLARASAGDGAEGTAAGVLLVLSGILVAGLTYVTLGWFSQSLRCLVVIAESAQAAGKPTLPGQHVLADRDR